MSNSTRAPTPIDVASSSTGATARVPSLALAATRSAAGSTSPARAVLQYWETHNQRVGHENAGFLSWSQGFTPSAAPLTQLSNDFRLWDELAAELPRLHQRMTLRQRVEQMPVLDASTLPEAEWLRAAALLSITAHAYWYVDVTPPACLPPSISAPWAQLRQRLERQQEVLSYIDLIVYNWRYRAGREGSPRYVENLELLLPTVDNQSERVFYLTQVEILARSTRLVQGIVEAQDAVVADDAAALERALGGIIRDFEPIIQRALPKISAHPHSPTFVDPVVWAKTVAPMAVPIHAGHQGPSGTTSPIFNTLDLFFGRKQYSSFLGREIQLLREHYPPAWRAFLAAVSQVSVSEFVKRRDRAALDGAYREALEVYCGERGFLGRHRVKVYGFLELAFKVGRSITIGGFSGVFRDRTWDRVDDELESARSERSDTQRVSCQHAQASLIAPNSAAGEALHRIQLDVSDTAVRPRVGDRCAILPEHDPALVQRTLRALGASGHERVPLTGEWRAAMQVRLGHAVDTLPLRQLLRYGALRPLLPRVAEALHAQTQSRALRQALRCGHSEHWELWQILEQLRAEGADVERLWRASDGQLDERSSRWLPPERFRPYSISSLLTQPDGGVHSLELTVGQLCYSNAEAEGGSPANQQQGTASTFLVRAARAQQRVPFCIERPARFQLPEDSEQPIVLFAGGTGISPCRALIQQRHQEGARSPTWLLLSLRSPEHFLYSAELREPLAQGTLRVDVAFTRCGGQLRTTQEGQLRVLPGAKRRIDDIMLGPATARQLWDWIKPRSEGGLEAVVYVCGRGGFAATVLESLTGVFERHCVGSTEQRRQRAQRRLYELSGQDRLQLEVHNETSSHAAQRWIDFSEVARHNDAERGYWMVIDRIVYDVTRLIELHPGGSRVLQAYAGMDATQGFSRAHRRQPDVDAMREMYRVGLLRPLELEPHQASVESPTGPVQVTCASAYGSWLRGLQLVVEMQNALRADHSLQRRSTVASEEPQQATRYKYARAMESHQRFLTAYLQPLLTRTWPGLFDICHALFAPSARAATVTAAPAADRAARASERLEQSAKAGCSPATRLQRARRTRQATYTHRASEKRLAGVALADEAELAHFAPHVLTRDERLLDRLKQLMLEGLRLFETHEQHLRQKGGGRLLALCDAIVDAVEDYYAELALLLGLDRPSRPPITLRPLSENPAPGARRLHFSEYWLLEDYPQAKVAVLQRSAVPPLSLDSFARDNAKLLTTLSDHHRSFGLVVDTRHAPIRNDRDFERTTALLRERLTQHFARTAILIDSGLGELQVARLERDEGRTTLITRDENSALRFAGGGG